MRGLQPGYETDLAGNAIRAVFMLKLVGELGEKDLEKCPECSGTGKVRLGEGITMNGFRSASSFHRIPCPACLGRKIVVVGSVGGENQCPQPATTS